jgi:hypothetical protein
MKTASVTLCLSLVLFSPSQSVAWWECGHHIIAVLAYDLLTEGEQERMLQILAAHPRYAVDFKPPKNIKTEDGLRHWLIGRAGYWPDVARRQPKYNRPTWHYQSAATLTIGDDVSVPKSPGRLPDSATLETQDLHIAQAIELCRRVMSDRKRTASDRAVALSWLAHLVGDAHQPCHAGSLYAAGVFPDGDRGANGIPLKQTRNLHGLWDSLLGKEYDATEVRRRIRAIRNDGEIMAHGRDCLKRKHTLNPSTWLSESRAGALTHVYTPEILTPVRAVSRGLTRELAAIDVSDQYIRRAGRLSQFRAASAAHRLAAIWRDALHRP